MRTDIMIAIGCVVFVATAFAAEGPAEAAGSGGSYCLKYDEGGSDCGFTSLAQCNATASGIGAECYAVAPQAAMQGPGAYAFHPDARPGTEADRSPGRAMAAMPMPSRHRSNVHRNGHGM